MTEVIIIGIFVFIGFLFQNNYKHTVIKSVGTAYLLWVFSFFGLLGFHRFYVGKYGTGLVWFFTFGFFGIGAFIDLITLSNQVNKHNLKVNQQASSVTINNIQNKNSRDRTQSHSPDQTIQPKIKVSNSKNRLDTDQKLKAEIIQDAIKNIKITVTTSSSKKVYTDDSIIDITDQSYRIKSSDNLEKYGTDVPYWPHKYVYSYSDLNNASLEQKKFYNVFKINFLNGKHFDLEGNTNYAFILLFDLLNEYDNHKDFSKLESQLKTLGQCYPKTKFYGVSFLRKKIESNGLSEDVSLLNSEDRYTYTNYHSNFDHDYWKLGSKYKTKLKLSEEEVTLLNHLWYPSNNFCSIEFCFQEVLKLFIAVTSELKANYESEGTSIDNEFLFIADIIVRKQFNYRKGSYNYKYTLESTIKELYSYIFKHCENAVRELYGHKRKLNTDAYYTNDEAKIEFESKIISKISDIIPIYVPKVTLPDEPTDIELYSQTTTRWKIKFEELTTNYNGKSKEFVESILKLGKLNKRNPSVENIFFEASKFISKYDKVSSLTLYIHYLYQDLKSTTFDNKQLTKTIQKSLFKTNEQLHDFEKIVSELIKDKNLEKALRAAPKIYEVKRKKIQLDKTSIKEVQQQHLGTVDLLNEYLRDDFEDENTAIISEEINNEEIEIKITQKNEDTNHSAFIAELAFKPIQVSTLELFSKNNLSILQSEIEDFAKSKGVFKNQLIDSINENCYEFLDDVLIEEEDDYYSINPEYFQKISI